MKRKVMAHGKASLTVSLPSVWTQKQGVHAKDELTCDVTAHAVYYTKPFTTVQKEAELDMTVVDRTVFMYMLRGFYRAGIDKIVLVKVPQTLPYKDKHVETRSVIKKELERLTGFEIVEDDKSKIVISQLAMDDASSYDAIFRRVFRIIIEILILSKQLPDSQKLEQIEDLHDMVTKLVSFCMRVLSKQFSSPKTQYEYSILATLDRITDILKYSARAIPSQEDMRVISQVIEKVSKCFDVYYEYHYQKTESNIVFINNMRYELDNILALEQTSQTQSYVCFHLSFITHLLLDLVEASSALHRL